MTSIYRRHLFINPKELADKIGITRKQLFKFVEAGAINAPERKYGHYYEWDRSAVPGMLIDLNIDEANEKASQLLSKEEVAKYLGVKPYDVLKLVNEGTIPPSRESSHIKYLRLWDIQNLRTATPWNT